MPSTVVGGAVLSGYSALNCRPNSRSLYPAAFRDNHSPAVTEGSEPMTVTSSGGPLALTLKHAKSGFLVEKVTRSIRPEISLVTDLGSGIARSSGWRVIPRWMVRLVCAVGGYYRFGIRRHQAG